jgi:hypothetical protein
MLRQPTLLALIGAAILLLPSPAVGQVALTPLRHATTPLVLECRFELGSGESERLNYDMSVARAGIYRVQAAWAGASGPLGLVVTRQAPESTLGRTSGASPLTLEIEVPEDDARKGVPIRVSVWPLQNRGAAAGWVLAERTSAARAVAEPATDPRLRARASANAGRAVAVAPPGVAVAPISTGTATPTPCVPPSSGATAAEQDTVRTILADGRIETRYPDGRIVRMAIEGGCYEVIWPNQPPRVFCYHSNVIRTQLADLPPELLADSELGVWLEDLGPHLLDAIQAIISDPSGFENYTTFEGTKPLAERIDLRLRLLNTLLANR